MQRVSLRRVLQPGLAIVAAFAMLVIAVAMGGVAHAAQGDVGGRPAYPKADNPRTNEIYIHTLNRGDSVRDGAIIVNNTDETKVVKLYATDGVFSNIGALTCKQEVEDRVDVGSWVTLDKSEITLEPRSNQVVDFTVAVPANADVGEHNGCIVYQVKDQVPVTSGNISIQTRSATRLSVTIPGTLNKSIDIAEFKVENKEKSQFYHMTIDNTGNVSSDTEVIVTLSGLFGGEFYKNQERYPVLPSNKMFITYKNESLPVWGGWYWAEAKIAYNGQTGQLGITGTSDSVVEKSADRVLVFIVPHLYVLLGLFAFILLLVIVFFVIFHRRKEKRDALRNWPQHTVKAGETIQSIADKQDIKWKKLARLNSLKAPYALTIGDKIHVPKKLAQPVQKKRTIKVQ